MISYELAKQLKLEGFDQDPGGDSSWQGDVLIPTLSQLIEACGDGFFALTRADKDRFTCHFDDFHGAPPNKTYSTPEESVAYLWMALNKKEV